ncbi:MAG: hypothetical protein J6P61_04130 [Erysipelotrichaceae bacterium]|nr:hypothetical protein [Erysipelotrichaceae bacterium]
MFKQKKKALGKVKEAGHLSVLYAYPYQDYTHVLYVSEDNALKIEKHFHHDHITTDQSDGYFLGPDYLDYCRIYIYLINQDQCIISPVDDIKLLFGEDYSHLPEFKSSYRMIPYKRYAYKKLVSS